MESEEGAEQYLAWLEKEYFSATAEAVEAEGGEVTRRQMPLSLHVPMMGVYWPLVVTRNPEFIKSWLNSMGYALLFIGGVCMIPVVWSGFMWFVNGQ